jgi:hypothetical protein
VGGSALEGIIRGLCAAHAFNARAHSRIATTHTGVGRVGGAWAALVHVAAWSRAFGTVPDARCQSAVPITKTP